jgi:hypothetical protein
MRKLITAVAVLSAVVAAPAAAAHAGRGGAHAPHRATNIAVFGDLPYSAAQIASFDNLSASVNADPTVSGAMHLGDIKSGSTPCVDSVYTSVRDAFNRFAVPLVFTPGDNEWTDCHRTNNGSYLPTERLAFERSVFFSQPSRSLGRHPREVEWEHAEDGTPALPENAAWRQAGVQFATLNIPGSNNSLVPWSAPWDSAAYQALQATEVADRTRADLRWIDEAFNEAREGNARGVVLAMQADMWDVTTPVTAFTGYGAIVRSIASHALAFGKPVLLMNGDSHHFQVDNPLADPTSPSSPALAFNQLYGITTPVKNLTRLTVQGSTSTPSSWVKLTIDPTRPGLWSFVTVPVAF